MCKTVASNLFAPDVERFGHLLNSDQGLEVRMREVKEMSVYIR
jgi:hypothetical protein